MSSTTDAVIVIPNTLQVTGTLKAPDTLAVQKGALVRLPMQYQAQTFTDQGITVDNVIPASETDIMDRKLMLRYQVVVGVPQAAVAAQSPAPPLFTTAGTVVDSGEGLYLRSFPLQQCCSNATLTINGVATSVNSQNLVPIFSACTSETITKDSDDAVFPIGREVGPLYRFRLCPSVGRRVALSNTVVVSATTLDDGQSHMRSRGVSFVRCEYMGEQPAVPGGNPAYFVYRYTLEEDIVIPPFTFGNLDAQDGVTRVQNLRLQLTMNGLQRMFCVCDGRFGADADDIVDVPAAPLQVSIVGSTAWAPAVPVDCDTPVLRIVYNTPDPILSTKIAPFVSYPYTSYSEYIQSVTSPATVDTFQQKTLDAVRLTNIADKFVIGVSLANQVYTAPDGTGLILTNTWLPITQLSLIYNTRSGIFANYTTEDLWRMSRRNGLKCTYQEYLTGGGPLIIDTAFDIGLLEREAAGQAGQVTVQFQITYSPQTAFSDERGAYNPGRAYEFRMITHTPARCVIGGGTTTFALQGPSQSQVLTLLSNGTSKDIIGTKDVPADDDGTKDGMVGAGFSFHKIKGFLRTAGSKVLDFAARNPDVIAGAAKHLGSALGVGGDLSAGDMSAGGMRHHRARP